MEWKKVFTSDYFGIGSLLAYSWNRLRGKPHFFGDKVHKDAVDEAMRRYRIDETEENRKGH